MWRRLLTVEERKRIAEFSKPHSIGVNKKITLSVVSLSNNKHTKSCLNDVLHVLHDYYCCTCNVYSITQSDCVHMIPYHEIAQLG